MQENSLDTDNYRKYQEFSTLYDYLENLFGEHQWG